MHQGLGPWHRDLKPHPPRHPPTQCHPWLTLQEDSNLLKMRNEPFPMRFLKLNNLQERKKSLCAHQTNTVVASTVKQYSKFKKTKGYLEILFLLFLQQVNWIHKKYLDIWFQLLKWGTDWCWFFFLIESVPACPHSQWSILLRENVLFSILCLPHPNNIT